MKQAAFWLTAAVAALAASGHAAEKKGAPAPLVRAPAWVLMDVDTGRVLEKHNARKRMFPASTTKTLMALTALRSGRMDVLTTIGPNPPKTGESSINLLQGEQFTVRDLARAAMIKSANDACVAVAEGVSGSVPKFMERMNAVSREVGARESHWTNPHGLHDPRHYTTALDLALIARAALRDEWFNETVAIHETTMPGNEKVGPTRILHNRNRLLFRWNECDGVKTGYTRQAGRCLVASATRMVPTADGPRPFRLLSVVLHAPDSWADSRALLEKVGFARFRPQQIARAGQEFGHTNVAGGAFDARAITPRALELPLRRGEHLNDAPQVRLFPLRAPVKQGQTIGSVTFFDGKRRLAEVPLQAREAVPIALGSRVFPPARRLPSNPSIRYLIYGCVSASLALLLIWFKLRAQETKTSSYQGASHDTRTETRAEFYARLEAERQAGTRARRREARLRAQARERQSRQ